MKCSQTTSNTTNGIAKTDHKGQLSEGITMEVPVISSI